MGSRKRVSARPPAKRERSPAPKKPPRSAASSGKAVSTGGRAPAGETGGTVAVARRLAFTAVALALLFALAGVASYLLSPHRGRGVPVRVTLPEGGGAAAVTRALWTAGVIDRPWLFHGLVLVTGAAEGAHPGLMVLRDDLTPRAVLRALASGSAGLVRVTIPEGFTRYDIARRLSAVGVLSDGRAFLAATESPGVVSRYGIPPGGTMEGYLFPDTYDLPVGATPEAVIDRMARVFTRRWETLKALHPEGMARAAAVAGPDGAARAVVVLASLVERETGSAEDRAHVAGVFWNRLTLPGFHPRLLQSDPTVAYGCLVAPTAPCGDPDAGVTTDGGAATPARTAITAAMLTDDANPYNTYRHEGLPPGPVCNPGVRALEAALAPVESRDVYFVARGDGRSVFAATLEEHSRNVVRYLHRAARDAAP